MAETIKTTGLTKKYGHVLAANDINLSIGEGQIFGLLGLNGAGKTTIIRMLLGMIRPSAGKCYLQGQRVTPGNTNIWHDVGYIVETPHSYPELTVRENLEIVSRLRNVENKSSIDWIMKKLKLQDYASRKARHLSLGNSQRLGIAKAIIHRPKILILDEPTNGLDPAGIVEIRHLLLELARDFKVTILISSHKLDEIAKVATDIAIIHHGSLIERIDSRELENQLEKILVVEGRDREYIQSILTEAGYEVFSCNSDSADDKYTIQVKDRLAIAHPERIATLLVNAGHPPRLLKVEKEDLERYFLRIIDNWGDKI